MRTENPSLFRKLSEPHESLDAADAEVAAFFQGVKALREKHKLVNVVVIVELNVTVEGDELVSGASAHWGSSMAVLPMLAKEFGAAKAEHEVAIMRLVKDGKR